MLPNPKEGLDRRSLLGAAGGGIAAAAFTGAAVLAQEPRIPPTTPPLSGAAEPSWHSPSLTMETVTATNGAVTTQTQIKANSLWGLTETTVAEKVTDGVYALRGWGIASSYALEAPGGWIIIDTGDSTRAAAEMRGKLEQAVGRKIKVAAILLTHWHYADGTGAWLDEGTETWGHEYLDRNRSDSKGVSIKSGFYQARAIAQFGVFHPMQGPDAFPSLMRFFPEKLLSESSYQPPSRLFQNGKVLDIVVAGEPVQVAPNRTDTSDSVAFYFPRHRLAVTNMMITGAIFNIYTLRGGAFRNPQIYLDDARWVESKNAAILLDIHGPTLKGEKVVHEAIERSVDQVQLIHDQTLRLIAHGMDAREAAEALYMPRHLREGREAYGQVESHVRQVVNGTVGWFGADVYDINPLSLREEAARTIDMMGGVAAVRKAAADAAQKGGLANWRWSLKLTSMLLRLDPQDAAARAARATAARALGQRTTSANARGFYITEALQIDGQLKVEGQPMTLDAIRAFVGTPSVDQLTEASVDENLQFVRYLVDPRKAEAQRLAFTISVEGDPRIRSVELRNSVLVISNASSKAPVHVDVTRRDLAEFVRGKGRPSRSNDALTQLDQVLDRSQLIPLASGSPKSFEIKGKQNYSGDLEH
ncbi:MAG: MBL fold metallo-hydrolase [Hyphomicrobiales bacterium]|nr:MBL fold metallo-hydrolase [Hyphomicrobiales bacterium]